VGEFAAIPGYDRGYGRNSHLRTELPSIANSSLDRSRDPAKDRSEAIFGYDPNDELTDPTLCSPIRLDILPSSAFSSLRICCDCQTEAQFCDALHQGLTPGICIPGVPDSCCCGSFSSSISKCIGPSSDSIPPIPGLLAHEDVFSSLKPRILLDR
jgi:hypothetical protein